MKNVTLLLPVAGRSSRYPNMRPKWLLTHPRGTFMLTEAIRGLQPSEFKQIVIVALQTQEEDYRFKENVVQELKTTYTINNVEIILLKDETTSQPETVYQGITRANIQGKVLVKDSDNVFTLTSDYEQNFVAVGDLAKTGPLEAGNKSYVQINENIVHEKRVSAIIEKQVISNFFCCGGYFFTDANQFCEYFNKHKGEKGLFISHIIHSMLQDKVLFGVEQATGFEDWGTLEDWQAYVEKFATLFVSLDGVIVHDSHQYFDPKWGTTEALKRNSLVLNKLYDTGKVHILITTSRPELQRKQTEEQLRKLGIKYHSVVMGLPHASKQILINNFSQQTMYKAAVSMNLRTNDDRLDEMLASLMNANKRK